MSKEQHILNSISIDVDTIYKIRELFDKGFSSREICDKLNLKIGVNEIQRIGLR